MAFYKVTYPFEYKEQRFHKNNALATNLLPKVVTKKYVSKGFLTLFTGTDPKLITKLAVKEVEPDLVCDICGKLCKSQFGLDSHKRTHKKE